MAPTLGPLSDLELPEFEPELLGTQMVCWQVLQVKGISEHSKPGSQVGHEGVSVPHWMQPRAKRWLFVVTVEGNG